MGRGSLNIHLTFMSSILEVDPLKKIALKDSYQIKELDPCNELGPGI